MREARKRKPSVGALGIEKESKTLMPLSYLKNAADVKLVCGICSYYNEKSGNRVRRHCSFSGESVRAGDPCHLDPQVQAVLP